MESYTVEAILSATDKGFTKAMKDANNSLGGLDDKSKKASVSIGDIMKGVGVFKLVDGAVNMVTSSLGGAINRFDTLNKYPTVMQALGYSTQEVDKSMNKLTNGIEGLPTKLDSIVSSAQQLSISAGSLDKGTDYAIAFNNAMLSSGASTAEAEGALTQFSQALGKGKLQGDEFNSVASASPLLMSKMAESFGYGAKGTTDLKEALSSGKITAQQFADKMVELNDGVGGFADLAKKNSKGIKTSFENIKSSVVKGMEQMIRSVDEGLQGAGLGSIADNLDKTKGVINETFKVINAVIPPMIKTIVELVNVIKPVAPLILGMATSFLILKTAEGIPNMMKDITKSVKKLGEAFSIITTHPIIFAITALIVTLTYLWKTNEDFRNAVIKIWQSIADFLQPIINVISNFITSTFGQLSDWFNNNQQGIQNLVQTVWGIIQSVFELSMIAIKFVVSTVLTELQTIWEVWSKAVSTIVQITWAFISNIFSGSLANILSIVTFGINQIKLVIDTIMATVRGIIQTVWSLIIGDWKGALDGISQIIDAFGKYFTGTFDNIMQLGKNLIKTGIDTIKGIFNSLADIDLFAAGKAIIDSFIDGLKQTWENGKKFVGGIADWIREHKGPISYDRTLLIDNGKAIMDGLNAGLDTGFGKVQDNVNDMTKFFANTAFNQDFEIGANFSDLDKKINSMNDMNLSSNNELTLKNSAQPAEIKLNMGGRVFSAFVEDIGAVMQAETDLNLQT